MTINSTALHILDQLGQALLDAAYDEHVLRANPVLQQLRQLSDNTSLDEFPEEEMISILQSNGIDATQGIILMVDYVKASQNRQSRLTEYCNARSIAEAMGSN